MKTKYLAFAAAAFALASCSSNDDIVPQDDGKDTPVIESSITVTADVDGMDTRAGYEGTTTLPDRFYLTVIQDADDPDSEYNYTDVEMVRGENNRYSSETTLQWKDASHSAFISAYTTTGTKLTVLLDQRENFQNSDHLGAISTVSGDVTITGDNIGIRFRHLLCKLDITLAWNSEYAGNEHKTFHRVCCNGFGTEATLDRATCTVTAGTATSDQATNPDGYVHGIIGHLDLTKSLAEVIFAPQTEDPKININAYNGVDESRDYTLNVTPPAGGFVPGKRYTIRIALGGTKVEDITCSIADGWVSKDGGSIEID